MSDYEPRTVLERFKIAIAALEEVVLYAEVNADKGKPYTRHAYELAKETLMKIKPVTLEDLRLYNKEWQNPKRFMGHGVCCQACTVFPAMADTLFELYDREKAYKLRIAVLEASLTPAK